MADLVANDFMLALDEEGIFDLVVSNGTVQTISSFDTALLMLVFCERRANAAEVPLAQYRRGWLGNEILFDDGFEIGSKLWLAYQERWTEEILQKCVGYLQDASQWLVDNGHLKTISVSGQLTGIDGFAIKLDYVTVDGQVDSRYYGLWKNTGKAPIIKTMELKPNLLYDVGGQPGGNLLISEDLYFST